VEHKISAKQASRNAGLSETTIGDILRRNAESAGVDTLQSIAKVLKTTLAYLLDGDTIIPRPTRSAPDAPAHTIPVFGKIEIGSFSMLPASDTAIDYAPGPLHPRFPNTVLFGRTVVSNEMNRARPRPILPGDTALFVDFLAANLVVETGRIYLVQRKEERGKKHELSLRRARRFNNHVDLLTESSEEHPLLVAPADLDGDKRKPICVLGLWYATVFIDPNASADVGSIATVL
jgi:transcriptional regulator with XRE-family HTH domain